MTIYYWLLIKCFRLFLNFFCIEVTAKMITTPSTELCMDANLGSVNCRHEYQLALHTLRIESATFFHPKAPMHFWVFTLEPFIQLEHWSNTKHKMAILLLWTPLKLSFSHCFFIEGEIRAAVAVAQLVKRSHKLVQPCWREFKSQLRHMVVEI